MTRKLAMIRTTPLVEPKLSFAGGHIKVAYGGSDEGYEWDRFDPLYYGHKAKDLPHLETIINRAHQAAAAQGMKMRFSGIPYGEEMTPKGPVDRYLDGPGLVTKLRKQYAASSAKPGEKVDIRQLPDFPHYYELSYHGLDGVEQLRHPLDYAFDHKLDLPKPATAPPRKGWSLSSLFSPKG